MALLQAGGVALLEDGARPPDPDNPLGYHEYEPVKRLARESGWLDAAAGRAVKVIHTLLPALPPGPRYRVILMRRRLSEVVNSQDRMLARRGQRPGRLPSERLEAMLAAQLEQTRAWLRDRPSMPWLELDYNALLVDPVPGLQQLVAFAGLRAQAASLAALIRPELHRVRAASDGEEGGPAASAAGPDSQR
jgi:hypothetical protein